MQNNLFKSLGCSPAHSLPTEVSTVMFRTLNKPIAFPALLATLATLAVGSGCSTAKVRVMPGENGVNQVIARDIERDGAEEAALDGANSYCKDRKKEAVILNHGTKYTGSMDESARGTIRKASKVAMILGPGVGAGTDSVIGGSAVGAAGVAGTTMTNDRDYSSTLDFKCR